MRTVEIRCPVGPQKLLSKLILNNRRPHITDGNLIEFACYDCARAARMDDPTILRILHRYDLVGTLVESVEVHRSDEPGR
jgi:hypothetical protein